MIRYLAPSVPGISLAGLLLLILLFLPLALLVFLFVRSGRNGRIVIGSLAAVMFAFLFVVSSLLYEVRHTSNATARTTTLQLETHRTAERPRHASEVCVEHSRHDHTIAASSTPAPSAARDLSSGWTESPGGEKRDLTAAGFDPDIHASQESAVRAVTRLVAKQYKAMIASEADLPRIAYIGYSSSLGAEGEGQSPSLKKLTQAAAVAVQEVFQDNPRFSAAIHTSPAIRPPDVATLNGGVFVYLSVIEEPWSVDGSEHAGILEGTIRGALGEFSRRVEYLDKPWNDDFDRWRNARDDPASWVLGESENFCPDRARSIDQAMRDAASHLREPVSRQLMQSPGRQADLLRRPEDLYRWLDAEGYRRLKAHDFKTDVFTQEFKRPYGSVWRSAVRVHVTPDEARLLLHAYQARTGAHRVLMLRTLFSAVGLLVLIVAVYGFLSAATRGYYVWSVRLATGVLAAVGVLFIWTFVA